MIFVEADAQVRRKRVQAARGWTADEWIRRENSQMPLDKKKSGADHTVVNNSSDLDQLRPVVQQLLENVLAKFARGR